MGTLIPMSKFVIFTAIKLMSSKERISLKEMGQESFLNSMISKKDNMFDRESWIKVFNKL